MLCDLFGLPVDEGALVNMLPAGFEPFRAAVWPIKARLLAGTTITTGSIHLRIGRANW